MDQTPKSDVSGKPTGSYVYVMYNGEYATADFTYDQSISEDENQKLLRQEILDKFLEPVIALDHCEHVRDLSESKEIEKGQFSLVLFKAPSDEEEDVFEDSRYILTELARRENFIFKGKDVKFYYIENVNCMGKYVGTEGDALKSDTIVLFSREMDFKTGEIVSNPKLINRVDVRDFQRLNRWVSSVVTDVKKVFDDRIIHTVMDEQMFVVALIRSGGRPKSLEDYEEMADDDKNAVQAFESFSELIKFKQQRMLIIYADPWKDKAMDGMLDIQDFFMVEFKQKSDLPAIMIVDTIEEKVEFIQPIETVTEDVIGEAVSQIVFYDLFEQMQAEEQ